MCVWVRARTQPFFDNSAVVFRKLFGTELTAIQNMMKRRLMKAAVDAGKAWTLVLYPTTRFSYAYLMVERIFKSSRVLAELYESPLLAVVQAAAIQLSIQAVKRPRCSLPCGGVRPSILNGVRAADVCARFTSVATARLSQSLR